MKENFLSIFYVVYPDAKSANRHAQMLIEQKFAACCNLIPNMTSTYLWNQKIDTTDECVLIIKTLPEKIREMIRFIEQNHPYEVPCICNLTTGEVNQTFYQWMVQNLQT